MRRSRPPLRRECARSGAASCTRMSTGSASTSAPASGRSTWNCFDWRTMFDHVTIRVSDRAASERFYETVLGAIGVSKTASDEHYAEWDDFSLAHGDGPTRALHVGFCAWSHEDVDAFWRAGVAAGYESDGEPGMRTQYSDDYYGAFLLDPDGNSA